MKAFLLTFETRVPIWIDMKLKMPRSKGFPPKVVYFNGRHVGFTNEYAGAYKYWLQKDRMNLKNGRNQSDKFLIQFFNNKWVLRSARMVQKKKRFQAKDAVFRRVQTSVQHLIH